MLANMKAGVLMMAVMTLLTGLVYPAVVTVLAQVLFSDQANGSLIIVNDRTVGSRLIGQGFTRAEYFHSRPSSAGAGYDPTASAGSNLGPTSAKLINGTTKRDVRNNEVVEFDGIKLRVVHYCVENGLPLDSSVPLDRFRDAAGNLDDVRLIEAFGQPAAPLVVAARVPIPPDAVMGSASGLDPDISPRNADLQTARVARARGVPAERVRDLVVRQTRGRALGLFGEPHVNVLQLNLALDAYFPRKSAGR